MRLSGKVALVTGASKGLGRSAAELFAREGAKICAVSRSIDDDAAVVQEIKKMGQEVITAGVDVSKREQVDAAVAKTIDKFGRLDILLTMGGITRPAMLHKMTEEQWDTIINIHLKGTFNCIQAVFEQMKKQNSGSIITVTSAAGLVGTIGQVNYSAAKSGIVGMTKSAAKELARYNIRVNAAAPLGRTDMTELIATDERFKDKYLERVPLKRFGDPETDIAPALLFLASDDSHYITGQVLNIDGGMVI
jgi:3-oxoacyl-[acyl-carrier protein] reductase